jgi:hypothetical protein
VQVGFEGLREWGYRGLEHASGPRACLWETCVCGVCMGRVVSCRAVRPGSRFFFCVVGWCLTSIEGRARQRWLIWTRWSLKACCCIASAVRGSSLEGEGGTVWRVSFSSCPGALCLGVDASGPDLAFPLTFGAVVRLSSVSDWRACYVSVPRSLPASQLTYCRDVWLIDRSTR